MALPSRPPRPAQKAPRLPAPRLRAPAAASAPPLSKFTVKRMVWTGAFAAVTIVGALYGAGLKTQQEFKAEKQQLLEATPEERIRDLETRRGVLMSQKIPLEMKLKALKARMRANETREESKEKTPDTKSK